MNFWVPVVVALLGIAGTLLAALLTQRGSARAEADRRRAADRDRWLANRLELTRKVLATAEAVERQLHSDCAFLTAEPGPRSSWLGGHLNVLATPEEGVAGVLDAEARAILLESQDEWSPKIDELMGLSAEVQLICSTEEGELVDQLLDALLTAASNVEAFTPPDEAYAALSSAMAARKAYTASARRSLRVDVAAED